MKYTPKNNRFPEAIIINHGTNKVFHFFLKGSIVQPQIFNEDDRSYLCKYIRNGLPDKAQFVHEEDLISTQNQVNNNS